MHPTLFRFLCVNNFENHVILPSHYLKMMHYFLVSSLNKTPIKKHLNLWLLHEKMWKSLSGVNTYANNCIYSITKPR